MSNLPLQLEFRDSAPHFFGPIRGQQYSGHEWMSIPVGSGTTCSVDGCVVEAYWTRLVVAHPNDTDFQDLCKEHGAKTWLSIPDGSKSAVLVVRDWDDEFVNVIYEVPADGAKFPDADYYS